MKTLYVLRHAKSSWKHAGLADHDRPLNARGCRDAPRMARLLREGAPDLGAIISSTAVRARATATAVSEEYDNTLEVRYREALYLAEPPAYLLELGKFGGDIATAGVVGHNPGLEELVGKLTGEEVVLPTAALAQIALDVDDWGKIAPRRGKLLAVSRPKELSDEEA